MKKFFLFFLGILSSTIWGFPTTPYFINSKLYDQYRFAATYYYGITCEDKLLRITQFGIHRWPEHIQSFEFSHTLSIDNFLRRRVNPIVDIVQLAGNVTSRTGSHEATIYEFDPYLAFRWANLPWNRYVNTSFAIGEGVSYVTSYIALEKKSNRSNTKRFLNYLMFEATIAPPSYPRLQFLVRIHHRSGAFGLYRAKNAGSNVLGCGIRYLFD